MLAALGSMLALTGGAPTTIVVFSGGLTPPADKKSTRRAHADRDGRPQAPPNGANDICPVRPDTYENIGMVASSAHADMYLFHLTEAMANRSRQDAGFESLAGVTDAEFFRLTASPQAAISRLLRETASYYTPRSSRRPANAATFRVELHATRDKVRLRTRPSVDIRKGTIRPARRRRTCCARPPIRGLPLRAAASPRARPAATRSRSSRCSRRRGRGALAASVGLFDEKNTLKKQWTAQPADLAKRPVMAALPAPPGTYRVRVAAVDASGRAGTTDYELKVESAARIR